MIRKKRRKRKIEGRWYISNVLRVWNWLHRLFTVKIKTSAQSILINNSMRYIASEPMRTHVMLYRILRNLCPTPALLSPPPLPPISPLPIPLILPCLYFSRRSPICVSCFPSGECVCVSVSVFPFHWYGFTCSLFYSSFISIFCLSTFSFPYYDCLLSSSTVFPVFFFSFSSPYPSFVSSLLSLFYTLYHTFNTSILPIPTLHIFTYPSPFSLPLTSSLSFLPSFLYPFLLAPPPLPTFLSLPFLIWLQAFPSPLSLLPILLNLLSLSLPSSPTPTPTPISLKDPLI